MEKANIAFRMEKDKIALLDQFAAAADRDRSYLIKGAVDHYLGVKRCQAEEIKEAIAGADAGGFGSDAEMEALFAKSSR